MSLDNLAPIVTALGNINEQIKLLTERKKELEAELRPVIVDKGTVVFKDYTVECFTSAGRKTLDKKALEAAQIDLEPYYKVGAPFTTLRIKPVAKLDD